MCGFKATYYNIETEEERTWHFELDSQFFENCVNLFMFAMKKAVENTQQPVETFVSIEYLYS